MFTSSFILRVHTRPPSMVVAGPRGKLNSTPDWFRNLTLVFHRISSETCFLKFSRVSRYLFKRPKQWDILHLARCWDILVNWHSLLVACDSRICVFSVFHVICMPYTGVNLAGHTSHVILPFFSPTASFSLPVCVSSVTRKEDKKASLERLQYSC